MALTDSQIIQRMRDRGILIDVDDAAIVEAINAWINFVQTQCPLEALGAFQTVAGQQEYDLFGVGGPLAGGFTVLEIYGPSGDCGPDLDVFGIAPLLQNMGVSSVIAPESYSFNVPGDFLIGDRVWDAFRERFSTVRFVVKEGRLGSPILVVPPPGDVRSLMVRYTRPRTDAEARVNDEVLLNGVEWRSLELLARQYALTAGVRIGDHEDKGLTARMYWDMAREKRKDALGGLDQLGCGAWTFSAATRS